MFSGGSQSTLHKHTHQTPQAGNDGMTETMMEITEATLRDCIILKLISITVCIHMIDVAPVLPDNTLNRCGSHLQEYIIMPPLKQCIVLCCLIHCKGLLKIEGQNWASAGPRLLLADMTEQNKDGSVLNLKASCLSAIRNNGFGGIVALWDLSDYAPPKAGFVIPLICRDLEGKRPQKHISL